jgi:hypothetical protein
MSENNAWWHEDNSNNSGPLFDVARRLRNRNADRVRLLEACEAIYSATDLRSSDLSLFPSFAAQPNTVPLARSMHDTLFNRFAKNQPKPEVMPVAGNWDAQNKAKVLTQWLAGLYAQNNVYTEVQPGLVYDGLMYGTGALKIHDDAGICFDRCFVGDLLVHPKEEQNRKVITLYQSVGVDREVLKSQYGNSLDLGAAEEFRALTTTTTDPVDIEDLTDEKHVVEAWRLPIKRDDEGKWIGGHHVISLSNKVLLFEPWEIPEFPFVFWNFRPRPRKFFGMGVVESVLAAHLATNDVANIIDYAVEAMTPKIMCLKGSVPKKSFTNKIAGLWEYEGTAPQPWNPAPVNPQVLQREDTMLQRAYRFEGVSEQDSQGVRPQGINSGIAQQTMHDISSIRYAVPAQMLDDAIGVALPRHCIRLAEKATKENRTTQLTVIGQNKNWIEAISYADARIDEGKYQLHCAPVSQLPDTPQGKLEYVDLLRQMGIITDPIKLQRMMDMPDIDAENAVEFAGFEIVDKIIAKHLEGKPWEDIPKLSPYMPIAYAIDRITKNRDLAQLQGAPQEVLDRMGELLGFATNLAPPAPAATMPAVPGAPAGAAPSPMQGSAIPPLPAM